MAAPRVYVTPSELGAMFGTTSKYVNEWLSDAGVAPARSITVNKRNFHKYRMDEAIPALQARRANMLKKQEASLQKSKEKEELQQLKRLRALEEAKAAARVEQANAELIEATTPVPVVDNDGPNYTADDYSAFNGTSAVSAAYVLRELAEIKEVMNKILDAFTTPQGTPR